MTIKIANPENFDKQIDNQKVLLINLKNKNGFICQITNYGARIVSFLIPINKSDTIDVVLGLESIDDYLKEDKSLGAIVGRYANRIAKGSFTLDGKNYPLFINDGCNTLHGGQKGFDKTVWKSRQFISKKEEEAVELSYLSKDGEEGFPGNLQVKITYTLTNSNELQMEYWAETDAKTVLNLTNHTYFNLKGAGEGTINSHDLVLNADFFTPTNKEMIPTGEIWSVANSPMDFRTWHKIGERINQNYLELTQGNGYDHNWVLNKKGDELSWAATVSEESTGIVLNVFTTEPGIQFYTGNYLDGKSKGKGGKKYTSRTGFCLEAQHYPNSPNQENFPSTILNPGETYKQTTIYQLILLTN